MAIEVSSSKQSMNIFSSHGQIILTNGTVDVPLLPGHVSRLLQNGGITELRDLAGNLIQWSDRVFGSLPFTQQWRPVKEDAYIPFTSCRVLFKHADGKFTNASNADPYSRTTQIIWGLPYKPLLVFYGKSFVYVSADTIQGLKLINPYMPIEQLIPED